ncbi:MAG: hypothetical protein ABIP64_16580 [Burkholderiales bacterium]
MLNQSKLILAIGAVVAISSIVSVSATAVSLDANQIVSRRGADDKPGDVKGEGAGHPVIQGNDIVARRGADDKPGDVKGEGAGHPVIQGVENVARRGRGADDPAGHVRREDRRKA